jgi:hypothetical protein
MICDDAHSNEISGFQERKSYGPIYETNQAGKSAAGKILNFIRMRLYPIQYRITILLCWSTISCTDVVKRGIKHSLIVMADQWFLSGVMAHYKTGSKKYGLDNKEHIHFKKIDSNPLFNDFWICMLDQLYSFQHTGLRRNRGLRPRKDDTARWHCDLQILQRTHGLHRDTHCVQSVVQAGRPSHCWGTGHFLHYCRPRVQDYLPIKYNDLHQYLSWRLTAWYKKMNERTQGHFTPLHIWNNVMVS